MSYRTNFLRYLNYAKNPTRRNLRGYKLDSRYWYKPVDGNPDALEIIEYHHYAALVAHSVVPANCRPYAHVATLYEDRIVMDGILVQNVHYVFPDNYHKRFGPPPADAQTQWGGYLWPNAAFAALMQNAFGIVLSPRGKAKAVPGRRWITGKGAVNILGGFTYYPETAELVPFQPQIDDATLKATAKQVNAPLRQAFRRLELVKRMGMEIPRDEAVDWLAKSDRLDAQDVTKFIALAETFDISEGGHVELVARATAINTIGRGNDEWLWQNWKQHGWYFDHYNPFQYKTFSGFRQRVQRALRTAALK